MIRIIVLCAFIALNGAVRAQSEGDGMMGPPNEQFGGQQHACPGGMWQFMCDNGECIAQYDLCDHIVQCSDGSDESDKNCGGIQRGPSKTFTPRPLLKSMSDQMKNAKTIMPTASTVTTTPKPEFYHYDNTALTWLLLGASGTVVAFAVFVILRRRCRKRAPGASFIRRGDKFGNEEDDLLISSMYS